jgi:dTDP-4-dehydrorhamnose 3,5-epimerase
MIEPAVHGDARGYFYGDIQSAGKWRRNGLTVRFVQDNQSLSVRGVLRGLHFQKQFPQGKAGFGLSWERYSTWRWIYERVQARFPAGTESASARENRKQVYLPEGFATGLSECSRIRLIICYKGDRFLSPQRTEGGLIWNDPDLGFIWPLDSMNIP